MYIVDEDGGTCIDLSEVTNEAFEEEVFVKQGIPSFGVFVKKCAPTDEVVQPVLIDHMEDPTVLARRYRSLLDGRRVCGVEVKPLLATDLRSVPEELRGAEAHAVNVSWEEASAYCEAKGGRLPARSELKQARAEKDAERVFWRYSKLEWTCTALRKLQPPDRYSAYNARQGNVETTFRCAYSPLKWPVEWRL